MNALSAAERKATERVRRRRSGFRPYEVWCHPDDVDRVRRYVAKLNKKRSPDHTFIRG